MGKVSDFFSLDRYRSQARLYAGRSPHSYSGQSITGNVLPLHSPTNDNPVVNLEAGGLEDIQDANGSAPVPGATLTGNQAGDGPPVAIHSTNSDASGSSGPVKHNDVEDGIPRAVPPPAPPPIKSEAASSGDTTLDTPKDDAPKPPLKTRFVAACKRGFIHGKNAIFHSWINVLLIFVPVGIVADAIGLNPAAVFAINAVAIIPLASLLTYATESVASRLGDTLGALLNVSFGNAVELIIFIIALVKREIRIVQASLLGSILSNLLLILGMAFLLGGLRFREQIYNSNVTQMSACLLSLSVMSLLLPTAFHASFSDSRQAEADLAVLRLSRGTSVILLIVYVLYLLFQLKSHSYMYESTPQEIIDEESYPGVLADIMNSSSSDDGSSSDSSDSDSDGSGSILQTGRRFGKKMFKRRRRRSNASTSSATPSSAIMSTLSSPSTTERRDNYWESHISNLPSSRRASNLGVIASGDEAEAKHDGTRGDFAPRVRDFVPTSESTLHLPEKTSASVYRKKFRKRHHRKHHKKQHHHHRHHNANSEDIASPDPEPVDPQETRQTKENDTAPRVGFADDVDVVRPDNTNGAPSSTRLPFNMRQLSSRASFRPTLPKMLSNNVFVQPIQAEPVSLPTTRPPMPIRAKSVGTTLRRTNSLPGRLNNRQSAVPEESIVHPRTDPLPPYQHTRPALRSATSQAVEKTDAQSEAESGHLELSRTAAVVLLLISTGLVAACAEFMVDAIPAMLASQPAVGEAFIGLIILPIVSNAAEHVTAVTVAAKNKMDLAIGVAVGSSIQIALFVTPIVVLLGWILNTDMSLYFNLFETVSLFVTAFVINFLILDGRSNYLEGSLLIAAYVIIAVAAFYYPSADEQSAVGGGASDH